jgi:hypothetical protein
VTEKQLQAAGICGRKWDAPVQWPPGVQSGTFEVAGLGEVVTDKRSIPQTCALPKGHTGPHRSLTNVTTA